MRRAAARFGSGLRLTRQRELQGVLRSGVAIDLWPDATPGADRMVIRYVVYWLGIAAYGAVLVAGCG